MNFCSINISNGIPLYALQNIMQMLIQLSQANNITPIVSTIIPPGKPSARIGDLNVLDSIQSFNNWLRKYSAEELIAILDLARAVEDKRGFLPREYSKDPIHLNESGYTVISDYARPQFNRLLGATEELRRKIKP
jgi:lysophospholipase L1-like esterase